MRKVRRVLELKHAAGLGVRQIARSLRMSHGTVLNYLERADRAGVSWPLPAELDDAQLQALLFPCEEAPDSQRRGLPAMSWVHKELRRTKGMTLRLLWEEYRAREPEGYGYTQFCEYYRRYRGALDPALRQEYAGGEKLFVDWAGETIPVTDPATGAVRRVHLFVAAQGASNYTYAEAFEDTRMPAWIEAHIHAWEFFGGVNKVTVADNTKTAVSQACRYEPTLNSGYEELAEHYGTVLIPARAREPRDKAKVENAVQNAERRIIAALRDATFFSLGELNRAVRRELDTLNTRPFQKLPGCRRELFRELDLPALLPLPARRYELGEWRKAKANIDYHVQVERHNYSVPHMLTQQLVDVRLSLRSVEIFHRGKRVAVHARSNQRGGYTTDPAHRPKSHQRHADWSPSRLVHWAGSEVGVHCAQAVERLLELKPHPEQGYRACLGIMRLGRHYSVQRLEAACRRAVALDACSYRSIKSILRTSADRLPLPQDAAPPASPIRHENLRGRDYYAADDEAPSAERRGMQP